MTSTARRKPPPLSVDAFRLFVQTRPDEERWELIEGVPVLNPSPIDYHQMIVSNIVAYLIAHKRRTRAAWLPMLGVGTRVPVSPRYWHWNSPEFR